MPWFYCSKVNVLENGYKEPFKKTLYTLVRNEDFYKNPWEWYIEDIWVHKTSLTRHLSLEWLYQIRRETHEYVLYGYPRFSDWILDLFW